MDKLQELSTTCQDYLDNIAAFRHSYFRTLKDPSNKCTWLKLL